MTSVTDSQAPPRRATRGDHTPVEETTTHKNIVLNGDVSECEAGGGDEAGHILLVEPFYGGSHKQLIDLLYAQVDGCVKVTLPAKKWHWRARTAALYLAQHVPQSSNFKVLFCSSVLNLAELAALRPDLCKLHKVLYFHENQLVYPVRKQQDRDFQYGYNQILSCLVADVIVFNSKYNMTSFLDSIGPFLKLIPDHRPRHLADLIRPKCRVLNFPIRFPTRGPHQDSDPIPNKAAEDTPTKVPSSRAEATASPASTKSISEKTQVKDKSDSNLQSQTNGFSQNASAIAASTRTAAGDGEKLGNSDVVVADPGHTPVVKRRPTCLSDSKGESGSGSKPERRSMCFSPGEPLGLQLMSPIDAEMEGLMMMGRGRLDFTGAGSNNMRRSETEPSSLMGGNLPCALDLSPTTTCKSLNDVTGGVEAQVKVEVKVKSKSEGDKEDEESKDGRPLHVLWPHRWEHDKDPETFFRVLFQLHDEGCRFKVSVLGETYTDTPAIFREAEEKLSEHITTWGYLSSKAEYWQVLEDADVVVSTARHEFFGVAMLEAAYYGCYPLCPNDLVYPEIFPRECLYNTTNQLAKTLRQFCKRPLLVRNRATQFNVDRYSWKALEVEYKALLTPP